MTTLFLFLLLSADTPKGAASTVPKLTDAQKAEYWKRENAVNISIMQCEPCQLARVNRNAWIQQMAEFCGADSQLVLDASGDPTCRAKEKK
jgi:hypothetical protein